MCATNNSGSEPESERERRLRQPAMALPEIAENEQHTKVDPRREADVEYWAGRFGISKDEFRRAAEQAGPRLGDIRQHLIGGFTAAGPTS